MDIENLRRVVGASAAVVTALQAGTAALALAKGRRDYADGLWGPGLAAVADRQKAAYSARDRDERPDVPDTGLWGVSQHPSDSIVWDGLWLAGAASAPGAWLGDRPAYRDYQRRVSFFFPGT